MFKTISAALLAVSVLAAPALAATSGKTDGAPLTKQAPVKTTAKTGAKTTAKTTATTTAKTGIKSNVLNANAKMGGHHLSHRRHYQHHSARSHHKTVAAHKTHTKVSLKQAKASTKRG
jgi:hypothetical protein